MRLLIIRHGDPDYVHDSLTEKGEKEAKLLAEYLAKEKIDHVYVSPLGRAQKTASYYLEKTGKKAETLEWLKEFDPRIQRPDRPDERTCAWDWLPSDWMKEDCFYDDTAWFSHPVMKEADVQERYHWVCENFDELLAKHGYVHHDRLFEVTDSNHDTIALFCHFGLECVLLSDLLHVSPMPLWHGFCAAPTSVTLVNTEERREGTASFRIARFGDVSHLYAGNEEPAFAARYAECFEDDNLH